MRPKQSEKKKERKLKNQLIVKQNHTASIWKNKKVNNKNAQKNATRKNGQESWLKIYQRKKKRAQFIFSLVADAKNKKAGKNLSHL